MISTLYLVPWAYQVVRKRVVFVISGGKARGVGALLQNVNALTELSDEVAFSLEQKKL